MHIYDLDDDSLLLIFEKCSIECIYNLRYSCKRFADVILAYLSSKIVKKLTITGYNANSFDRTLINLSDWDRMVLYRKWTNRNPKRANAKYFTVLGSQQRTPYLDGRIHLAKNYVYISRFREFVAYKRNQNYTSAGDIQTVESIPYRRFEMVPFEYTRYPVCFKVKNDLIFIGFCDGCLLVQSEIDKNTLITYEPIKTSKIFAVDFVDKLYIATEQQCTTVLRESTETAQLIPTYTLNFGLKYVELLSDGRSWAGFNTTILLGDVETKTTRMAIFGDKSREIIDLTWMDNNTLLFCDHNQICIMDTRIGDAMAIQSLYSMPNGSIPKMFCMRYDNVNSIFAGAYDCVALFDTRKCNETISTYFRNNGRSLSPADRVVSIDYDAIELMFRIDDEVNVLNFNAPKHSYQFC